MSLFPYIAIALLLGSTGYLWVTLVLVKRRALRRLDKLSADVEDLEKSQYTRTRKLTMNLVTAHDLIIELLQAQRLHTDMVESHALKALRQGIEAATTPENRVAWLVTNVPKVIRAIANERLKQADAAQP